MFKKLMPVILALTALPAGAATVYYTGGANSESAFNTATGPLTFNNFTGELLTAPNFYSLLDAGPTGVDFYGFSNNNVTPSSLSLQGGSTLRNMAIGGGTTGGATLRIDLPTDIRAFGLHFTATQSSSLFCFESAGIQDCGHLGPFVVGTAGTTYFFGIISDTAISSFQIRNRTQGAQVVLQDFAVSLGQSGGGGEPPSETPEPSTLALLGSALIAFPLLARRKRGQ